MYFFLVPCDVSADAFARFPLRYHDCCVEEDMSHGGYILQHHTDTERSNDFKSGMQIIVLRESDQIRLVSARVRHEPDSHLYDNSQRGLGKDAIVIRTKTVIEELPGVDSFLFVRWSI